MRADGGGGGEGTPPGEREGGGVTSQVALTIIDSTPRRAREQMAFRAQLTMFDWDVK